jgi:hypothetical protein
MNLDRAVSVFRELPSATRSTTHTLKRNDHAGFR